MSTTVAIPAYNEESFLSETVKDILEVLRDKNTGFEIIISEGGSDDGTSDQARTLQERHEEVKYLDLEHRRGKGEAIEEAFKASKRDYFIFMDADGATAPEHLPEMIEKLETYDIVTGVRRDRAERDSERKIASKAFNYTVRVLFSTDLSDHQCGFKGFRSEILEELIGSIESRHWFWDTELLVKAREKDLDIGVLEIDWEEKGGSKINVMRDGIYFSHKLLELRVKQWID